MGGKPLSVVFFDAMGTVLSLKSWVVAMVNEFTQISKKYNVKFEDISRAWDAEWRKSNQDIRRDKTKPFQSVRELFYQAFSVVAKRIGINLEKQDIMASIERVYNYVNGHSETFPDVPNTLEILKKQGYEIGIVSDADADDLTLQLKSAGILRYFDMVTTSSEVRSYKPDTKIFEVALGKMKCKSSQACHVGDTPEFDVVGANRIGLRSILVTHGKIKVGFRTPKPTYVINEVSEVVPLLQELSPAINK